MPLWWLEAVCRHACASREDRYCSLSRNRIGPVKLEEGSITCPFCVISSTPSQANCTAMRRVSGMSGRHALVRARGASEGQHVFVRPRLRTSSRILASSAPSASGLHSASSFSSRRRLGIMVACVEATGARRGSADGRARNGRARTWEGEESADRRTNGHKITGGPFQLAMANMNGTHTLSVWRDQRRRSCARARSALGN